jgi:hypothetical protein
MTAEDVKALPIDRKIQIMEAIWDDSGKTGWTQLDWAAWH